MSEFAEDSLEQLMRLALEGDKRAYQAGLQKSAALLRPFIARKLKSAAAVDDVLQDILIAVHKSLHTYDGKRPYAPWLYAIANYKLTDYLRSLYKDKLRHAADIADHEFSLAEDVTEGAAAYEYVEKAMKGLPDKQVKILTLIHHMGYTSKEAAAQLGMTETAVKVSAHRAYKILRKKLESDDAA